MGRVAEDPSIDGSISQLIGNVMIDSRGKYVNMSQSKAQERGNLIVHFHKQEVIDKVRTDQEKRPCYKQIDCIMLITPGDKDNILDREVWDDDRFPHADTVRFRAEWERYQKQGEQSPDNIPAGHTPLDKVAFLERARVLEYRYFNCFTVEQLADFSDSACQKMMGSNEDRQRARDFLASINGTQGMNHLRAENDAIRNELDALKAQIAALGLQPAAAPAKKSHKKQSPRVAAIEKAAESLVD